MTGDTPNPDMQIVAVPSSNAVVPARSGGAGGGGKDGAIVEYQKSGAILREDEEDLEVKLRRIIDNVPVRVSNTSGSSAGSGSGDFHQYRQMRRKEQDRVSRMDADYQRRKEIAEFNMRREERLKAAEERTAKKRSKRQKKKQKKKEKKIKMSGGEEDHQGKGEQKIQARGDEHREDEYSDNEENSENSDYEADDYLKQKT